MGWLLLALIPMLLLLLPVTVTVFLGYEGTWRIRITASFLMLHKTWQKPSSKSDKQGPSGGGLRQVSFLINTRKRTRLLRHVRVDALDALILLHTEDAASSALIAGGLNAVARIPSLAHRARIQVLPDFFRGQTSLQAKCIIRAKLGILIIILLAAKLRHHQEGTTWNIPLEN